MAFHRHQASLEHILDFSQPLVLSRYESEASRSLFTALVNHHTQQQTINRQYKSAALIRSTFEHVLSQDAFLHLFFLYIYNFLFSEISEKSDPDFATALAPFRGFPSWTSEQKDKASLAMNEFADYMIDNFFLPLRASSVRTPQPTPTSISSRHISTPAGSSGRVSILRRNCLIRDHHRCVISQKFDKDEAKKRFEKGGFEDDDGRPLGGETSDAFQYLEVAHILPHSLTSILPGDSELSDTKKNVLQILNMFDPGIIHLIDGPKIDSPMNALTLTHDYHRLFGEFEIFFEPTGVPYQYTINTTEQRPFFRDPLFPVIRTLSLSPERTIDPPSPRLLGVHRAVTHILKLSGAGDYIEQLLREMEEVTVKEDGSTNLERLVKLQLGGWSNPLPVF